MMRGNPCPKCGGVHVVRVPDNPMRHASGNNIYTTRASLVGKIPLIRYVCSTCGYTEEWVEGQDQRARISRAFS